MIGREGDRGQSHVLGAILVFGILILGAISVQTVLVPQDNSRNEFTHSKEIQEDMEDFRNSIIEAGASNKPRSVSLDLGMFYPNRFIFINPPPVSGEVSTTETGEYSSSSELILSSLCGTEDPVTSRFVTYTPDYNVFDNSRLVKNENSFSYRKDDESTNDESTTIDTGQVLIRGGQITLLPIVEGDLRSQSVDSESVDLIPADKTGVKFVREEEPDDVDSLMTLTIPSELGPDVWRDDILREEIDNGFVSTVVDGGDDKVTIELEGAGTADGPTQYTFRCTPIGINEDPDVSGLPDDAEDEDEEFGDQINPCCPSVELRNATIPQQMDANSEVVIEFRNNRAVDVETSVVRFSFYSADSQGTGEGADFESPEFAKYGETIYEIKGPSNPPSNNDTVPSDGTANLSVYFGTNSQSLETGDGNFDVDAGDWFVMRIIWKEIDTGDRFAATYFVPPEDE